MKKINVNLTPEEILLKMARRATRRALTNTRNYLTSDELNKFASIDVSNNPVLQECQHLFLEQVFCSCHDEDMVPKIALDAYHRSIGLLLIRTGIACNFRLVASIIPDLGFRTSANVIGEFRFVDKVLPNAK